ncbi:MAG: hypothetical protein WC635_03545 [Bacteriovorax sp.]|jgi:hypothetical protein
MFKPLNCFSTVAIFSIIAFSIQFPAYADGSGLLSQVIRSATSQTSIDAEETSIAADAVATSSIQLAGYKQTPDIVSGKAGGSTYLEAEILTNGAFEAQQAHATAIASNLDSSVDGGDAHINMLTGSYRETASILRIKKEKQEAAEAAYTAAASAAMEMKAAEIKSFTTCYKTIRSAYKLCTEAQSAASTFYDSIGKLVDIREVQMPSKEGAEKSKAQRATVKSNKEMLQTQLETSAAQFTAQAEAAAATNNYAQVQEYTQKAASCTSAKAPLNICDKTLALVEENESFGVIPAITYIPRSNKWPSAPELYSSAKPRSAMDVYVSNLLNFIISDGNAFDFKLSSLFGKGKSARAQAAMLDVSSEAGKVTDQSALSPSKRAADWELKAKVARNAADATQAEIDQVEAQGDKSEGIADKLHEVGDSQSAAQKRATDMLNRFNNKNPVGDAVRKNQDRLKDALLNQ